MAVEQMGGGTGLDVDRRDVVGDDVVDITRDPQPLLASAAASLLLAGPFGFDRPRLDLDQVVTNPVCVKGWFRSPFGRSGSWPGAG
jgi:hypothetical protein